MEQLYEILLCPPYFFTRAGQISVFLETYEAHTINRIYNIEKIPHGQRFLAEQLTISLFHNTTFSKNDLARSLFWSTA